MAAKNSEPLRIGYRIAMEDQRSTWNDGDFLAKVRPLTINDLYQTKI